MRRLLGVLGLVSVLAATLWGQAVLPEPDKDGVYSVGDGLTPAKLVHGARAAFPNDPGQTGVKRVCALRLVIGTDGIPVTIQVLNQEPSPFDDAAIAAVKQSQFKPGSYKGSPVPTRIMVLVPFFAGSDGPVPDVATASHIGVSAPVPMNSVQAAYPKDARKKGVHGVVLVLLRVTEDGLPADALIVKSLGPGFDENALKAAAKYRFSPPTLLGVPVPMDIVVSADFTPN